jgi:hypothetical protein
VGDGDDGAVAEHGAAEGGLEEGVCFDVDGGLLGVKLELARFEMAMYVWMDGWMDGWMNGRGWMCMRMGWLGKRVRRADEEAGSGTNTYGGFIQNEDIAWSE